MAFGKKKQDQNTGAKTVAIKDNPLYQAPRENDNARDHYGSCHSGSMRRDICLYCISFQHIFLRYFVQYLWNRRIHGSGSRRSDGISGWSSYGR